MSIAGLLNQEIQVVTRTQTGPKDDYGVKTWVSADPVSEKWNIQPLDSEEIQERPAGRFTHRGFAPSDSVVTSTSEIVAASGQSWHVDGPPREWINPRTSVASHIEVDLVGYTDG